MFSKKELDKIVKEQLPEGKTGAFVGTVDDKGVQIIVGIALEEDKIKIQGVYKYDWAGEHSVGGKVIWTW